MNPYKIIVELPDSDGFHTTSNQHLAECALRDVQRSLTEHPNIKGCTARIDPTAESIPALRQVYDRLLGMHMDTLLVHGAQVAQGLALAITTIHKMAPDELDQPWVADRFPTEETP